METPSCIIPLASLPLDCCVSPSSGLLAAALVSGELQLASFACPTSTGGSGSGSQLRYQLLHTIPAPAPSAAPAKDKKKKKKKASSGAAAPAPAPAPASATSDADDTDADDTETPSCRAVCFAHGGAAVLVGYSDTVVRSYDASTGKLVQVFSGEHDVQLSRVFPVAPHVFASGDEEGLVLLWDARAGGCSYRYKQHKEYVTDFALHERDQALVVTSGDGTLSIHDLRKRKARARSEDDDDELLSCAVVKGGNKVVAGTQSGVLNLYSWGYFNDCSDRFPGHPESVSAMVAFDDDTLLTGSSDGGVRVVGVLPNRLLGILGQHNGDFPIERLALSHDRRVLVSTSHDSAVKLWDLSVLLDDDGDDEGEEEEGGDGGGEDTGAATAAAAGSRRQRGGNEGGDEGADEGGDGEGDVEGDGDGSDEGEGDSSDWEDTERDEGEEEAGGSESGSGSGSGEGASEEDEEDKAEGGKAAEAAAMGAAARKPLGKAAAGKASKGGPTGNAAAAAGGKDGGGGDDGDGSDSDSGGDGGPKRKKPKRERTKWTKGAERSKQPGANFFADLL